MCGAHARCMNRARARLKSLLALGERWESRMVGPLGLRPGPCAREATGVVIGASSLPRSSSGRAPCHKGRGRLPLQDDSHRSVVYRTIPRRRKAESAALLVVVDGANVRLAQGADQTVVADAIGEPQI